MLVEIPLLTGSTPFNQLTSAKGTDSLDTQTRVASLDWSSVLDGGKTVRTGGGKLELVTISLVPRPNTTVIQFVHMAVQKPPDSH